LNIRVGKNGYVFLKKAYNSILCFGKREHGFVVLAKWIISFGENWFVLGNGLLCHAIVLGSGQNGILWCTTVYCVQKHEGKSNILWGIVGKA